MNIFEVEKNCLGCAGCIDICPVDALTLSKDENGFYIPALDGIKCVSCGKCVAVCPEINAAEQESDPAYYYGWNKDDAIRNRSSSGGIFRALADYVLVQNGVVFGAGYSEDCHAVKMLSTEETDIESLQRSKYVQANAAGLYRSIKNQLKQGKTVLLTGTPCQIAAARNICGSNEKLILVDFVCGGVPSSVYYAQYVEWLEKKYKSKIKEVNFRSKKNGWTRSTIRVDFESGKTYSARYEFDPYYAMFNLTSQTKNTGCLECKFTTKRYADITIADFWGFRKAGIPNDEKGMSLVVAHTFLGKSILNKLENVELFQVDEKDGGYDFVPRKLSAEKKMQREAFLKDFKKSGFIKAAFNGFFKHGKLGVVSRKIKSKLKGLFG